METNLGQMFEENRRLETWYTVNAMNFRAATPVDSSLCKMTRGIKLRMSSYLIRPNLED